MLDAGWAFGLTCLQRHDGVSRSAVGYRCPWDDPEGLAEWAEQVPEAIRDDPIWRLPAYRFALYLGDLAQQEDAPKIQKDYRTRRHLDQLLAAVGSISANIAEGYGRTSGPERAKFFEYANSS